MLFVMLFVKSCVSHDFNKRLPTLLYFTQWRTEGFWRPGRRWELAPLTPGVSDWQALKAISVAIGGGGAGAEPQPPTLFGVFGCKWNPFLNSFKTFSTQRVKLTSAESAHLLRGRTQRTSARRRGEGGRTDADRCGHGGRGGQRQCGRPQKQQLLVNCGSCFLIIK